MDHEMGIRIIMLKKIGLIVTLFLAGPHVVAAALPNIVLVMCDDLGWGDVGFNGNTVIQTPHLDEMSRVALKFNRFYAAAPVCSPTRGSVLTGRHPYRYGILTANAGHLKRDELTLAELLRKLDYRTGHFGKWHVGSMTTTEKDSNRGGPRNAKHYSPPQDNGFDICFSTESKCPTFDPLIKPLNASRSWWDPVVDGQKFERYGTAYWNEHGRKVTANVRGDDSRIIMDRAIPFIEDSVSQKKPFFTIVWFHAPHLPVVAGPEYTSKYSGYDKYSQHFFGCITALDEQVGRLRKTLRNLNVADNTIVTFCSDNGPEGSRRITISDSKGGPGTAGPFRGRKRDLFEGGIRVAGLIEWPSRIKPGRVTEFPTVSSDYLPTILDVVGVDYPDRRPIDGISLLPLIDGKATTRPAPIGFQSGGREALIDNRFKLVRYKKGASEGNTRSLAKHTGEFMLFDLLEDPAESTDIAAEHPLVVKSMARSLQAWQTSCAASNQGRDYTAE